MTCRAAIFVALLDPMEVAIWKRTVVARRALPDRYMWLDAFLLNHPAKHRPCSVRSVAHQTFGFEREALFDPVDHRLGRLHLLRSMCGRGFNINNDPCVQVDQIVCRISKECRSTRRGGVACGRISERDSFGWRSGLHVVGRRRVLLFQRAQILLYCAAWSIVLVPVDRFRTGHAAGTICICLDHTCIDGEAFAFDKALAHTATQDGFKDVPQCSTVTESAVPILRECGV